MSHLVLVLERLEELHVPVQPPALHARVERLQPVGEGAQLLDLREGRGRSEKVGEKAGEGSNISEASITPRMPAAPSPRYSSRPPAVIAREPSVATDARAAGSW